jgi:DNA uptake protein ComE-like DNA-binding protein
MKRTNKLQFAALAGLLAVVLAACGSTATNTAPTTAQSAPTTAAAPTVAATSADSAAPTTAVAPTAAPVAAMTKLDLNTLTEDQLMSTIPGFSSRMVREFLEYRPYISIQQFRKEIGKYVGADQVTAYEQYVYVPVAVDESDAATLQQIPGISAAIADQLIAGRPYGSNQAFVTKLASLAPGVDQQAAAYLAAQ